MTNPAILLVDDEAGILRACKRVLRRDGYTIFTTTDTDEALQLAREHEFAVVISDQRMPVMQGTELLEQIRQIQPACVRIILTGYADISAAIDAINKGAVWRFLSKPWDDSQLKSTIAHAVEQFTLIEEHRRLQVLTEAQNEQLKELNEGLEQRVKDRTREVTELSGRLDETLKGSLSVLAQLMEINSATIGNHSRRVADLARRIGVQMGLDEDELRQLEVAGLLHDIGKLPLPGQILRKEKSRLSKDELKTLQSHVTEGEAIVRAIPYLDDAANFIRHHHERFNGSGYPDALSGNRIPLGARIVAVADAFDKRLNSKDGFSAQTVADVLAAIGRRANEWFDKEVVIALAQVTDESHSSDNSLEQFLEVNVNDLKPGMILAQEVLTDSGALLIANDSMLTLEHIARLRSNKSVTMLAGIRVLRSFSSPEHPATTA
jgi:putative nucleotidyltransferase with HDIG domain